MQNLIKIAILAMVTVWTAVAVVPDSDLHVVFCDVGQGDAILISKGTMQVLVDTGVDERVLACLERYMPFYDRTIERLVVTHNDKDHAGGVSHVSERYNVMSIDRDLVKGDKLDFGEVGLTVLWPTKELAASDPRREENMSGIVGKLKYGDFDVLLTADVTTDEYAADSSVEIIKVPHHGSASGWNEKWWQQSKPNLAIISVGKNSYGHPAERVLESLDKLGIDRVRTDINGNIEVISNGKNWWLIHEKE